MGLEAECTVRVGRRTSSGKALLEGEHFVFVGDFRLDIPFEQMKHVSVDGTVLVLRTDEHEVRAEVGAHIAGRWARLITEPKGLFEKLEVTAESRVAVVDVRDSLFLTALRERTAGVAEGRVPGGAPIIFFGIENRDSLRKLQLLRARMVDTGTLWIVRPKGSSDISEAEVFAAIKSNGLVDTKVVSFSKTHTAHKCVVPVEMRGAAVRFRSPITSIAPPSGPSVHAKKVAPKKAGGTTAAKRPAAKAPVKKAPAKKAAAKKPAAKKPAAKAKKRR